MNVSSDSIMTFSPLPQVVCGSNSPISADLEKAYKANQPIRASLVHCLRTSGCVVFVAAAGFILYYLLAGPAALTLSAAPLLSLLAQQGTRGLGIPPKGDDRKYQHTVLPNGLQVV